MRRSIRAAGNAAGLSDALWGSPFLRACRGEAAARPPVWLMRQAGRYMAHYRGFRASHGFIELCRDPAAAAEVTLYARQWLGVDAAIIFSDILLILQTLGLPLRYSTGDGPQFDRAVQSAAEVDALGDPVQAAADLAPVYEACRLTVAGLPADIPLIGFCGAPFTLAAYAIEGGGSKQYARTRQFMYREPAAWHRLCSRLVQALAGSLARQVAAGCSAVQIFDSWAGHLSAEDYAEFAAPHLRALAATVPEGIPVILFGHGTAHLVDQIAGCGADVVGVDQFTALRPTWDRLGGPAAISVQGNLDPCLLLAGTPRERLRAGVERLRAAGGFGPGHIVNLGHGIMKESDPELARHLVELVHG
jgi:uroporphyrinogen decarboxylase